MTDQGILRRGYSWVVAAFCLASVILYISSGEEATKTIASGWELGELGSHMFFTSTVVLGLVATVITCLTFGKYLNKWERLVISLYGAFLIVSFISYLHAFVVNVTQSQALLVQYIFCGVVGISLILGMIPKIEEHLTRPENFDNQRS